MIIRDAVVREWDVSNESRTEIKPTTTFEGHTDWINGLALCANIGALASVGLLCSTCNFRLVQYIGGELCKKFS